MNWKRLYREIVDIVGRENVFSDTLIRDTYGCDASPYRGIPDLVVLPGSTKEVQQIVRLATAEGIPLVPRGAGTNLSGGAVASCGGIILCLARMKRILEVSPLGRYAVAEAGVPLVMLNQAAEAHGLIFAPDPGSHRVATLGGSIAECAGGMRGAKYGTMKHHVYGIEVVLPNGEVCWLEETGEAFFSSGLLSLFIGSEGTLGILTKARVKLVPKLQEVATYTAFYSSLAEAGAAVNEIVAAGLTPVSMEIIEHFLIIAVDEYLGLGWPHEAAALLIVELEGICREELEEQGALVEEILNRFAPLKFATARDPRERELLWLGRRSANGALGRIKPAYYVQDVTVPRPLLPTILQELNEIAEKYNLIIATLAHAGDGNLHPHIMYDPFDQEEKRRAEEAAAEIIQKALSLGGVLSGEHGIGLEKKDFMALQFSQEDLELQKNIKRVLDPRGIFNPDKVFPEDKIRHERPLV